MVDVVGKIIGGHDHTGPQTALQAGHGIIGADENPTVFVGADPSAAEHEIDVFNADLDRRSHLEGITMDQLDRLNSEDPFLGSGFSIVGVKHSGRGRHGHNTHN
jgi:hypothetical protein